MDPQACLDDASHAIGDDPAPIRFSCGCSLLGGEWLNGDASKPIPFSAPNLCPQHAHDLVALLVRRDGWIMDQADSIIAKSFVAPVKP